MAQFIIDLEGEAKKIEIKYTYTRTPLKSLVVDPTLKNKINVITNKTEGHFYWWQNNLFVTVVQ